MRELPRARPLTVVRGSDGKRNGLLLRFLFELGLIRGQAIISLDGADLRDADLRLADPSRPDLRDADPSGANLALPQLVWGRPERGSPGLGLPLRG